MFLKSLTTRLVLVAALLSILVLTVVFFYDYRKHWRIMENTLSHLLEKNLMLIEKIVKTKIVEHNIEALRDELKMFKDVGLLKGIYIFDNTGSVWFADKELEGFLPPFLSGVCVECHGAISENIPTIATVEFKRTSECMGCHGEGDTPIGYATLLIEPPPMLNLSVTTERGLLIGYIGIVFIFIIFGGYIHYSINRRLRRLRNGVLAFDPNKWEPFKRMGRDEIGEIAWSFNRMAERMIQHEKAIEESRAYLKNLFDNITDMVVVIDREYTIQYINEPTLRYLGKSEDEVLGNKCYRVFHNAEKPCSETVPEEHCGLKEAFSGKQVHTVHMHHTKAGKRCYSVRYLPFYMNEEIPYVIEIATDITESQRLQKEIKVFKAYAEELQGINTREEFFERLVRLGIEVLEADVSLASLINGHNGKMRFHKKLTDKSNVERDLRSIDPEECISVFGIKSGKPFVSESLEGFPQSRLKEVLKSLGFETLVSIPLKRTGKVVGVYNLLYKKRGIFRESDKEFLNLLTENINTVADRVCHYEDLKSQTERLNALINTVEVLAGSVELDDVLKAIVSSTVKILKPDVATVMLYNDERNILIPVSVHGIEKAVYDGLYIHLDKIDLKFDPKDNTFSSLNIFNEKKWAPFHGIASMIEMKSFYARCFFNKKGEKMGVLIGLWKEEHLPSFDEIELFNAFSSFAEVALEKAILMKQIITEQKHWEETFNAFSDPLFITDREFKILKANKAFYEFCKIKEDITDKKCYEIVHKQENPLKDCPHFETIEKGETAIREMEDRARGITVLYTTSPIYGETGEVQSIIHNIKDITFVKKMEREREELHQQLLHAQKMESIGTLTGGIAHDFNNILTAIMGHAELARLKSRDSSIEGNLEMIISAAERAKEFTTQLLLFGKKAPMDRRVSDLNHVIEESLRLLKRIIGEDIVVEFKKGEEPLYVNLDRAQFTQVLMNLCVNARDAMPEGGSLIIETGRRIVQRPPYGKRSGEYIILKVSDTGVGIPEDIRDRIFEPFFTTKPEGKGTGLGLSVVYSVVDAHDGFIEVYSTVGKGSIFEIYLPGVDFYGTIAEKVIKEETLPSGNEHVLLVDDEEMIRETGATILKTLGYRVTVASSGEEALQLFKADPEEYDIVISDLIMPGIRGSELYDEIRKIKDVPFVLITGYGRHFLKDAQMYSFNGIIEKPFNVKELAYRLRYILDRIKRKS